jgi:hypothetical protein
VVEPERNHRDKSKKIVRVPAGTLNRNSQWYQQVLSHEIEEDDVETRAALAARELIGDSVKVPPAKRSAT